jgi:signal transduction histidine kinase/CheY-like chemotaxis protein
MRKRTISFWNNNDKRVLQDNFQKIISALATHQIAIWKYDLLSGTCILSADYFKVLGLEQIGIHFVEGEDSYNSFHPDDVPLYQDAFKRMLAPKMKTTEISYRCIGTSGEVIWLEDHFLYYQKGAKELPDELIAYTINVTSNKEKELEISRLAEHNKKIVEAFPEVIIILDDNFYIIDISANRNITLLYPIQELIGADARKFHSQEVSELYIKNIRECLSDNKIREIEYSIELNGCCYYFQSRIAPFEKNKVLALIQDITNRVERSRELIEAKRRAEESDRMKTLFLANMSHEIRTPLNAIIGFSEIIPYAENEEKRQEYLDIIQKNSTLLLQLINDILDFSRIESGKSEMYLQPVNLSELVTDIGKTHSLKIPPTIRLNVVCPKEEIVIVSDANRLAQVLSNFMSNAIKNTKEGQITLGLSVEGDWVRLYVTDTGSGISQDQIPLIFDRFEKLDNFAQGVGLGLSICKSIVERLGGRIEVESEKEKGSTFSVYLYLDSAHILDENAPVKKKILISEESETSFKQLEAVLKEEYVLQWVRSGEKVMSSFFHNRPDLLLINMHLPQVSGARIIEKMRKVSVTIPIIAVTEHIYYTEQQQALQAGANEVVTKPYSLDKLKEVVDHYLKEA